MSIIENIEAVSQFKDALSRISDNSRYLLTLHEYNQYISVHDYDTDGNVFLYDMNTGDVMLDKNCPEDIVNAIKSLVVHAQAVNSHEVRSFNVGKSDYAEHKIQPWDIWLEYNLNPWDADIVKRVLRNKEGESRAMEYEKIIHDCQERIRQLAGD